ncbi:hypothetical protein KGQ20_05440, partial [Catenulispora sp. NF23]
APAPTSRHDVPGPMERAMRQTFEAIPERSAESAAVEALGVVLAQAVDVATEQADSNRLWHLAPRLLEVLRELRLTPASTPRKDERSALSSLLDTLSQPSRYAIEPTYFPDEELEVSGEDYHVLEPDEV